MRSKAGGGISVGGAFRGGLKWGKGLGVLPPIVLYCTMGILAATAACMLAPCVSLSMCEICGHDEGGRATKQEKV